MRHPTGIRKSKRRMLSGRHILSLANLSESLSLDSIDDLLDLCLKNDMANFANARLVIDF